MTTRPRRIAVYVVLPARTLLLDVAGPIEALRKANHLQSEVAFDVRYVGALPELTSSIGLRITGIGPLPETIEPDAMVVLSGNTDEPLDAGLPVEDADAGADEVVA
jgi:transcriptional regulator GlxA family with amidase domain